MKTIFFAIIMGLGLMAGSETARAQNEKMPEPQPPYLAPVPDYGHWMVTFKYKANPPPAPPTASTPAAPTAPSTPSAPTEPVTPAVSAAPDGSPTSIETIKTGDLRGVTLTFANGTSKQFTCQGDWVLNSSAKGAQLSIASPTALPYGYYTTGFILLDGVTINPSTFKKAEEHNGAIVFHYKSGDTDVWVDISSMLPITVKQLGVEATYHFLTPPPRPFDIPKDQESLLHKEQQAYKATSSMR